MSRWYLDTSAAMKLIAQEAESDALASRIDSEEPDLVACLLLETELRRAVPRDPALTQGLVTELLASVDLHELPASLFTEAGLLPGVGLRSLDAVHLAATIRLNVERLVTYDRRMADAAADLGINVFAPS